MRNMTTRVPDSMRIELDALVKNGLYANHAEAVRDMIRRGLESVRK